MIKKLLQNKGETLIESLVALLIATFSVVILTTAITASARINKQNRDADAAFTEELKKVENFSDDATKTSGVKVVFTMDGMPTETTVDVYSGDGELASYKKGD